MPPQLRFIACGRDDEGLKMTLSQAVANVDDRHAQFVLRFEFIHAPF